MILCFLLFMFDLLQGFDVLFYDCVVCLLPGCLVFDFVAGSLLLLVGCLSVLLFVSW